MVKLSPHGRPYFFINIILAGVIVFIMGYSLFYSPGENHYPVPCIHEKITGEPCPSCGLSHAFSLIVRGRVDEALEWNSQALRVFLFFSLQLVMRISLGAWAIAGKKCLRQVVIIDAVVSSVMALTAFYPFMRSLWLMLL